MEKRSPWLKSKEIKDFINSINGRHFKAPLLPSSTAHLFVGSGRIVKYLMILSAQGKQTISESASGMFVILKYLPNKSQS